MTSISQRAFSAGEIDPSLHSRTDYYKYGIGLKTCRNWFVKKHGGLQNRPGTRFLTEVDMESDEVRLIEFIYSVSSALILEFGEGYIRFIENGSYLCNDEVIVDSISNEEEMVLTAASHGILDGEVVKITNVPEIPGINDRIFKVEYLSTSTIKLKFVHNGEYVDSSDFNTITSEMKIQSLYEIETDYLASELFDIQFVQSNNRLIMAHQAHAPRELIRNDSVDWELSYVEFKPGVERPRGVSSTNVNSSSGDEEHSYIVTAISSEDYEESLPGLTSSYASIQGTDNTNPVYFSVNTSQYSFSEDQQVAVVVADVEEGVNSLTDFYPGIDHLTLEVSNVSGSGIELYGYDASSFDRPLSIPGVDSANRVYVVATTITGADEASDTNPIKVSWTKVEGAIEYNIYKRDINGVYGLLGISRGTSFTDIGETIDTTQTPPNSRNPFYTNNDQPGSVTYIQQRLCFGGSVNNPQKIYMSKTGNFKNFTTSTPIQDDDAVNFNLYSRAATNEVRHMLDLGNFVVLTSGGEWSVTGSGGVITPTAIGAKQYTYNGASKLPPITIAGSAIYQQERGSTIRDLGYNYEVDGYTGNDLSVFSAHLFENYSIVDWGYQKTPNSIVWAVRSDGKMIGLTYMKEQSMMAWHRHDTINGDVKSLTVIPEGSTDNVYILVEREIDGSKRRFLERLDNADYLDVIDSIFLDSSLTYDGRNEDTDHLMTISGGTNWTYNETLTLTSSESFFSSSDVGNKIVLNYSGSPLRCEIKEYTSETIVKVKPHKTVDISLRDISTSDWSKAVDILEGLDHLEGQDVSIFGDRYVIANPFNDSYQKITVTNGSIELDNAYSVVHVGLPITADVETLDIDNSQGESLTAKKKLINSVTVHTYKTMGLFVGSELEDENIDTLKNLIEFKIDEITDYEEPNGLRSGKTEVTINSKINNNGRVAIRQTDPLPATILSITPSGYIPYNS